MWNAISLVQVLNSCPFTTTITITPRAPPYIYIYIYICMCVCVCIKREKVWRKEEEFACVWACVSVYIHFSLLNLFYSYSSIWIKLLAYFFVYVIFYIWINSRAIWIQVFYKYQKFQASLFVFFFGGGVPLVFVLFYFLSYLFYWFDS